MEDEEKYCTCGCPNGIMADTGSNEWGYWDMCCKCGKRIEGGFHYYNHYDGEDHDDIDDDLWG